MLNSCVNFSLFAHRMSSLRRSVIGLEGEIVFVDDCDLRGKFIFLCLCVSLSFKSTFTSFNFKRY